MENPVVSSRRSGGRAPRVTPAVIRAFAILRLIRYQGPMSVREIAAELGLPRSSVHELVHTLVELGAVAPAADGGGRFSLHLLLHELGSAYLAQVRERGYALDDCESNRDVRCVAAPVCEPGGTPVAALSISVPTTRTGEAWPGDLADLVRDGARELSRRLGHGEGEATWQRQR